MGISDIYHNFLVESVQLSNSNWYMDTFEGLQEVSSGKVLAVLLI